MYQFNFGAESIDGSDIVVEYEDGTIKSYTSPVADLTKTIPGATSIKIYSPSKLGLISFQSGDNICFLEKATNITRINISDYLGNSLNIPASMSSLSHIQIVNAASLISFTTYSSWTNLIDMSIDAPSLESLVLREEWPLEYLFILRGSFSNLETYSAWPLKQLSVLGNKLASYNILWTNMEWIAITNAGLTSFSVSSNTLLPTGILDLSYNDLGVVSINNILITLDSASFRGQIYLNGGTNAAPTGSGITAKTAIGARGGSVITN